LIFFIKISNTNKLIATIRLIVVLGVGVNLMNHARFIVYSICIYTLSCTASEPEIAPFNDNTATTLTTEIDNDNTMPTPTAPSPEEVTTDVNTDSTPVSSPWHSHIEQLLVKGAFWNSATSTPEVSWRDQALDYAKAGLINKTVSVEDILTSFDDAINKKFILEQGSNVTNIAAFITEFKEDVEAVQKALSVGEPEKEAEETDESSLETPPAASDEEKSDVSEELVQEEHSDKEELEKQEQEELKKEQNDVWLECLKTIRSEGSDKDEVENSINDALMIAQRIILGEIDNNPWDTATIMKDDFRSALEDRSQVTALYPLDVLSTLDAFNIVINDVINSKKLVSLEFSLSDDAEETPMIKKPVIEDQRLSPDFVDKQEKPQRPIEEIENKEQNRSSYEQVDAAYTNYQQSKQTNSPLLQSLHHQFPSFMQSRSNENIKGQLLSHMKTLASKKVDRHKTAQKKGVLSLLAQKVFGSWWTGELEQKDESDNKVLKYKQDTLVNKIVQNTHDPITQKPLSNQDRELVRTAYNQFQELIVACNPKSEEWWDPEQSFPLPAWWQAIVSPLRVIIRFQVFSQNNLIEMVREILKSTMIAEDLERIESKFQDILKNIAKDIQRDLDKERARINQSNQTKELRKMREKSDQEFAKKQKVLQKELEEEKQLLLIQKGEAHEQNRDEYRMILQKKWQNLMNTIATSTSAQKENNDIWTHKALLYTQELLSLTLDSTTQQEIIESHKIDFSRALLAQQRNNPEEKRLNIVPYTDIFNQLTLMKKK